MRTILTSCFHLSIVAVIAIVLGRAARSYSSGPRGRGFNRLQGRHEVLIGLLLVVAVLVVLVLFPDSR